MNWKTSEEKEFDHFAIERSEDGIEFTEIGQVPGVSAGTSYEFADKTIKAFKYFYRLRMENTDGSFGYSKILHISSELSEDFKVYPTIVSNKLNMAFHSENTQTLQVDIINLYGQTIYQTKIEAVKGINHAIINLAESIPSGRYFVRLQDQSNSVSIIKQ